MKAVSRLLAAAVIFVVMAAPPAFARSRHSSEVQPDPPDLQVMSITDAWYPDLIVAPPISRPAGSSYDTPKPHSQWVEVAPAPVSVTANATAQIGRASCRERVFITV